MPNAVSVAGPRSRPVTAVGALAGALSVGISAWAIGVAGLAAADSVARATVPRAGAALTMQQAQRALGGMPLAFQPNVGQTDASVGFVTHAGGATVFLSPTRAVWAAVAELPASSRATQQRPQAQSPISGNALRMQLVGGNAAAQSTTGAALPGVMNYFAGHDPALWHTNVPTYDEVTFHDVYPGIDLAWYGNQGLLEYDFIVAPGADASVIDMAFAGADHMSIDSRSGDLVLSTSIGEARQHAPHAYQDVSGFRTSVGAAFVQRGGNDIGVVLSPYDHSLPLDIDPVMAYSTLIGGSGNDYARSIAVDASGNAYVLGGTGSPDFPTTPGAYMTTRADLFVSKLNPTGSALIYSTYLGGTPGFSQPIGIVVDSAGNATVDGTTGNADFPTTPGAFQTSCGTGCARASES